VATVGCASAAPPARTDPPIDPAWQFPQHAGTIGTGDAALLAGTAAFQDGCLWIVAGDGSLHLPLWPADTRLGMLNSLPAVLGPDGALLVELGDVAVDRVELGGSAVSREEATELAGAIPDRCEADGYWVVGDVLSRP
jgi:hypothetical protein